MNEVLSKWYALFADMAMEAQKQGMEVCIQKSKGNVSFSVSECVRDYEYARKSKKERNVNNGKE